PCVGSFVVGAPFALCPFLPPLQHCRAWPDAQCRLRHSRHWSFRFELGPASRTKAQVFFWRAPGTRSQVGYRMSAPVGRVVFDTTFRHWRRRPLPEPFATE